MRATQWMSGVCACGLLVAAGAHDNSWSTTVVEIDEASVTVALTVQTLSIVEVLEVDGDGDLWLTSEELEAGREALVAYLDEHQRVAAIGASGDESPVVLGREPTLERREDLTTLPPMQWVDVTWSGPALATDVAAVEIESTLFLTTSPGHRSFVETIWNGLVGDVSVLWMAELEATFERPAALLGEPEVAGLQPVPEQAEGDSPPRGGRSWRPDVVLVVILAVHAAGYGLRGATAGTATALAAGGAQAAVGAAVLGLATLPAPYSAALSGLAVVLLTSRVCVSDPTRRPRLVKECLVWAVLVAGFAQPVAAPNLASTTDSVLIWSSVAWSLGLLGWVVPTFRRRHSGLPDD